MKFDTFKKQLVILSLVFPNRQLDAEVYFEFWKDLDDEKFVMAVSEFIKKTPTLYPDTNLIAAIRECYSNKNYFDKWVQP